MKGRVYFWIYLDAADNLGAVLFKLYGQACSKCPEQGDNDDVKFCPAMWYPEEVVKVRYSSSIKSSVGYSFLRLSRYCQTGCGQGFCTDAILKF